MVLVFLAFINKKWSFLGFAICYDKFKGPKNKRKILFSTTK